MKKIKQSTDSFFNDVIQILLWRNILVYALSFYISLIMYNFFDSFVKDIFVPILSKILPLEILKDEDTENKLNYKNFLKQVINFSIACYVTYISIKFVKIYQGSN